MGLPRQTASTVASLKALEAYAKRPTTQAPEAPRNEDFEQIKEEQSSPEQSVVLGDSTKKTVNANSQQQAALLRYKEYGGEKSKLSRRGPGAGKGYKNVGNSSMGASQAKSSLSRNNGAHSRVASRNMTDGSNTIDFEVMDNYRCTENSEYSKLISVQALQARMEDQRRRLEGFLLLARQANAKKDQKRINDLLSELDSTKKPLPFARIQELKLLELMASPYN